MRACVWIRSPRRLPLAHCASLTRSSQSIVFIRDRNTAGQEVSGYVDYAHRLKTDDFDAYFLRKKRFMPRSSDLSFYNWETQTCTSTSTANYQVIAESEAGMVFKNKRDRKIITVDPLVRWAWLCAACHACVRACCARTDSPRAWPCAGGLAGRQHDAHRD